MLIFKKMGGVKIIIIFMLIIIPKPLYNETKTLLHSATKLQIQEFLYNFKY
jgi:hypothetical protein